jgi:hypothetical protein
VEDTDNVVLAAKAELEEVRRKAASLNERAARLEAFIALYPEFQAKGGGASARPRAGGISFHATVTTEKSSSLVIIAAAKELLSERGHIKTADLVKMLSEKGIQIGGKTPQQKLAQILSRKKEVFLPDKTRKKGWALTKAARKIEASNAANGAGLGAHTSDGVPS